MATIEERLALLEHEVAELKRARELQENRDLALLARIDGFINDLHRVERGQLRAFEVQTAQVKDLAAEIKDVKADVVVLTSRVDRVEAKVEILIDAAKDHKQAIESLVAGQQQILEILIGQQRRHD